jgi:hypothetical protein
VKPITRIRLLRLREKMLCLLVHVQTSDQLQVKRTICELFYVQKIRELELVSDYLDMAVQMLGVARVHSFYQEAYCRWRKDVRWLHWFLLQRPVL